MKPSRLLCYVLLLSLLALGACEKKSTEPEPSPLLGTWNASSGQVTLRYVSGGILYNITGPVRVTESYTFGLNNEASWKSGSVSIAYTYTTATVNGENQVTLTDKNKTNATPYVYAWTVDGQTLTLASKNYLAGKTSAEAITHAKLFAGIMGSSSTPTTFPGYANMTSATDIITKYTYTK